MRYFNNRFVLRQTPANNHYQVHQRLDYIMQEQIKTALPYSWHHIPNPSDPNSSVVSVRSASALNMPAEREVNLSLKAGTTMTFHILLTQRIRRPDPVTEKVREHSLNAEEMMDALPRIMLKNGLSLISGTHLTTDAIYIHKKGNKKFFLIGHEISVAASVSDVELAEMALVHGIGQKKIFGFGMLREVELY